MLHDIILPNNVDPAERRQQPNEKREITRCPETSGLCRCDGWWHWKAIFGHRDTMRQRKTRATGVTEARSKLSVWHQRRKLQAKL